MTEGAREPWPGEEVEAEDEDTDDGVAVAEDDLDELPAPAGHAPGELDVPDDAREWGIGNQILADLGLSTIRILTNNPRKISGLEGFGLEVVEQVPIEVPPNVENRRYLVAKRDKLGHRLHHQDLRFEAEEE